MKKVIGMFAALTLALGMSGFAYACWEKTLYIEGTVYTGDLDAEWSEYLAWDTEPVEKNYSEIVCEVDEGDPQLLHVTVYNAYPCIDYYNLVDIHNSGSIPLTINSITVDEDPEDIWVDDIDEITVDVSLRPNPLAAVSQPSMSLPVQLEPCDVVYALIHVHVEECAEEEATYEFEVEIDITNWNCD